MVDRLGIVACDESIQILVNDVPGLSEEEKSQLMSVMLKAKEFDVQEENKMRYPLEGLLFKYTNVVKGWQFRWFVLNPETGYLEYYMPEEKSKRPRGTVHLAGAVISPSDEDSELFILSAACGEVYKLRASDAKERQFWVNRLRAVAEYHTQNIAERNPPLTNRDRVISDTTGNNKIKIENKNLYHTSSNSLSSPVSPVVNSIASVTDALSSVKDVLQKTEKHYNALSKVMDDLPSSKYLDTDVLLLKATAHATVLCLEQCYTILQNQQLAANFPSGLPVGATVEWVEPNRTPSRIKFRRKIMVKYEYSKRFWIKLLEIKGSIAIPFRIISRTKDTGC